jgi:hypothetical protein
MPVKCCAFLELVVDGDLNNITPVRLDSWTGKCAVDELHLTFYKGQIMQNLRGIRTPSGAMVIVSIVKS